MQDYLGALVKRADFSRHFASDIVAAIEGTDQRADGREAAEQMIRYMPQQAFDARPELKTCWSMRIRRLSKRTSPAPIPVSPSACRLPAGRSGCRTWSSTTCATA